MPRTAHPKDAAERDAASFPSRTCGDPLKGTGYLCNRTEGHTGDHVAAAVEEIVARWPQTPLADEIEAVRAKPDEPNPHALLADIARAAKAIGCEWLTLDWAWHRTSPPFDLMVAAGAKVERTREVTAKGIRTADEVLLEIDGVKLMAKRIEHTPIDPAKLAALIDEEARS